MQRGSTTSHDRTRCTHICITLLLSGLEPSLVEQHTNYDAGIAYQGLIHVVGDQETVTSDTTTNQKDEIVTIQDVPEFGNVVTSTLVQNKKRICTVVHSAYARMSTNHTCIQVCKQWRLTTIRKTHWQAYSTRQFDRRYRDSIMLLTRWMQFRLGRRTRRF